MDRKVLSYGKNLSLYLLSAVCKKPTYSKYSMIKNLLNDTFQFCQPSKKTQGHILIVF